MKYATAFAGIAFLLSTATYADQPATSTQPAAGQAMPNQNMQNIQDKIKEKMEMKAQEKNGANP